MGFRELLGLWLAGFGLLACTPAKKEAPHSDILSVTLKFEDSSGHVESTLHQENIGKALADFISAARAAKKIKPAYEGISGDTGGVAMLLDDCMCDSPSDSLEIRFEGGRREKYLYYCDDIRALGSGDPLALDLSERDQEIQSNRWHAIRNRFCPRAYGCSDSKPPSWGFFIVSPGAEKYSDRYETFQELGWRWARILDSSRIAVPRVDMVITYHARGKEIRDVVIDSLDGKYAYLGLRFAKGSVGSLHSGIRRDSLIADSATVKITAYNAYYED